MKFLQMFFGVLFFLTAQLYALSPSVVDLKCDYRVNPIGIDRVPPKLSWRMDAGQTAGSMQTAYRIRSAATQQDLEEGNLLWDSNVVQSGECTLITYCGPVPMPRQRIWWQVKIYDNKGNESDWSEPVWFEMGLMEEKNWQGATWIGCDRDQDKPQDAPAEYMGDWLTLPEGKSTTEIFFDVMLSNKKVISAIAWCGFSRNMGPFLFRANYEKADALEKSKQDKMVPFMKFYDMAFFLRPGEKNRLSVNFLQPAKDFALTYGMRILYADGSEQIIRSGKDWKAKLSMGVVASSEFPGCSAINTINSSGFPDDGTHSVVPGNMWISDGTAVSDQWIVFDLGVEYDLSSMSIWNHNQEGYQEGHGRGIQKADVLVAGNDGIYTNLGSFTFAQAPGNDTTDFEDVHPLVQNNVRYVKFDIESNFSGSAYVGLSEVRFYKKDKSKDSETRVGDGTVSMEVAETYGGTKYGTAHMLNMTDLAPMWYRSGIEVKGAVKRARLYLCALGQGMPYLNGKTLDDHLMGVPQSDYEEFGYYTTHDITDQLKQGTNTLAVLLDAGWFHQVGGFGPFRFTYGTPGLKSLVLVEYEDGKSESFVSSTDWQFKEGALRSANIYRGERVDYRLGHEEWKQIGTGTGWKSALTIKPCTPKTVAMDVEPVRRGETLSPVKSWQIGPKTWLFDIGQTINGWVKFSFDEPKDTTIYLRYSEYAKDGVIENVPFSHWQHHRVMQSDWIIADGKPRVYESTFAPKSFRFVEICGLSSKPDDLIAYTVHSDLPHIATFKSSNPMLNRLFDNAMRTWRNYITHFYGDLPRERCLWGEESIYTEVVGSHCVNMAPTHRLMNTLWLTGRMTPEGIPGNIGVGMRLTTATQGYIWSVTPVFQSSFLYEQYGDLEPARAYYDKLFDITINYPKKYGSRGGTIPPPTNLHDHAPIFAVKRNPANGELLTAMIYYEALNRFARLSDALGKIDEAKEAREHAMKVHETIMSFYDNTNHTFGNGTHDSLALAFKIFDDPSEQKKLARSLAGYYKANGHRWDGGFLSYEVYPQLSRYGYVDDALEILLNTDSPGPAQSVKDFDATTYYETYWHTWLQKLVGQNFIAFTHSAGWMVTDLAGIRYQTPASSRTQLTLEPHFAKDLDFVESSVELPTGIVKSGWQRKNGMISWKVTVPANTETVVKLSQTDIANVTINGQSLKDAGVDTLSNQGIMTFTIKPGIWEIVLPSFK